MEPRGTREAGHGVEGPVARGRDAEERGQLGMRRPRASGIRLAHRLDRAADGAVAGKAGPEAVGARVTPGQAVLVGRAAPRGLRGATGAVERAGSADADATLQTPSSHVFGAVRGPSPRPQTLPGQSASARQGRVGSLAQASQRQCVPAYPGPRHAGVSARRLCRSVPVVSVTGSPRASIPRRVFASGGQSRLVEPRARLCFTDCVSQGCPARGPRSQTPSRAPSRVVGSCTQRGHGLAGDPR
jgi:hypothetical protein